MAFMNIPTPKVPSPLRRVSIEIRLFVAEHNESCTISFEDWLNEDGTTQRDVSVSFPPMQIAG